MSIVISNISKEYSRQGKQEYQLCLNSIPLVDVVEHNSEEGMSVLLRKCADALDKVDIDAKINQHRKELELLVLAERFGI